MVRRKTAEDEDRKLTRAEPSETQKVAPRMVVLSAAPEEVEEDSAPKGNIETRVVPWNGTKIDERPPSIGSMQPPGR